MNNQLLPDPLRLEWCPSCRFDLVYPKERYELSPEFWMVSLYCPNCEWGHLGLFMDHELAGFEEALTRGDFLIEQAYRELGRVDLVLTSDFIIFASHQSAQ